MKVRIYYYDAVSAKLTSRWYVVVDLEYMGVRSVWVQHTKPTQRQLRRIKKWAKQP